uniref:RNA-directed DNA polymerase, eukaryota, reverse transcriptase zinc-binding domain protein n=1 Tax=Tanacetum cinerariifolium TaxID=118510 RepID=A0A6L2LT49_TANCI|nr:RNA-directed DNA polymerase, eukaryota, reverse transcriptase zinc-binding domain protein [Tanacetum cinerariifolium]
MEYLVKISKKARILELKHRHVKITVLTSNTPYPSRKIRHVERGRYSKKPLIRREDLVSGLLMYEMPLSSIRKKYRLRIKNDMPPRDNLAGGRSGGIISIWDPVMFIKANIWCDDHKQTIWNYLRTFIETHNGKFMLFGDLNEERNESACYGSIFSSSKADFFNSFIDVTNLVDMPMGGRRFTWMNKSGTKISKLYRFILSELIINENSDLTAMWLKRPDFDTMIKKAIEDSSTISTTPGSRLKGRLKMFKEKNKEWNRSTKEQSQGLVLRNCTYKIDKKLDINVASDSDREEKLNLIQECDELDRITGLDLAQKAHAQWDVEGQMPMGSNSSSITLIPKVHNPLLINDFRPISMIGLQYKILAKLLANRLGGVIDKLVDFEKAYDSLSWTYLDYVLLHFSFSEKWRGWIRVCLHLARNSALINGSLTKELSIKRSLRQGVPLSPFLFILVVEGLHVVTKEASQSPLIKGVSVGNSNFKLSHLFYANDMVMVSDWRQNCWGCVEEWVLAVLVSGGGGSRKIGLLVLAGSKALCIAQCFKGPNGEALRKCILSGPYKPTTILVQAVEATDDSPAVPETHDSQRSISTTASAGMVKQYQNEVNELRAEKLARNANPLALVATAQADRDPYYQTSRSHRSSAPSSKPSIPSRSHTSTRHKGKEIAKPITPPSETASEEDIDPEQAQRDKNMQKNLALIAKYFKKIYKPTTTTSEHPQTPRTRMEKVRSSVVQKSGIQYFNCKEYGHFAKECRKPKRVKDSAYHNEKMLMCKQDEQGVPLQTEQYDWLADTDEEVDEQELESHYSYMAKIQEVQTADSCTNSEPVEQVQNNDGYNVFANHLQHSEQSESISNTCLVETGDSNVTPDSPDMCEDNIQNEQNDVESNDERAALANLIAILKLDVDENKKIQKQLKKVNTTLAQELKECKAILAETNALDELQCLYLHKVKECDCLAQKLSSQTESVSKEFHSELLKRFAKLEKHSISLEIALQKHREQNIAISELKKLIKKGKGKSMNTKFDRPSVIRQPNAHRIPKQSVLGVNNNTNVSRPQHKSNQLKDKVLPNNSQVKLKKTQVEVHPRIPSVSNKMKSVTACKESLNSKTLNANAVCATCNKCLADSNHFACVTKILNDMHARTKKPNKDIVIGLPKLKYVKDQLCSFCELSKAKRSSFKSKAVPSSKGRLNLLHMDLSGPMRVASINGKKYILKVYRNQSLHRLYLKQRRKLWKLTGKIFKTVGLRWVPTGRILTSSMTKVDNEPLNDSNADITNQNECEQTLDVNADRYLINQGFKEFSSDAHEMTSDHNSSELRLHDHINELSSSKLVPNVVPPLCKTTTA